MRLLDDATVSELRAPRHHSRIPAALGPHSTQDQVDFHEQLLPLMDEPTPNVELPSDRPLPGGFGEVPAPFGQESEQASPEDNPEFIHEFGVPLSSRDDWR